MLSGSSTGPIALTSACTSAELQEGVVEEVLETLDILRRKLIANR
jgi:hypothetical protein